MSGKAIIAAKNVDIYDKNNIILNRIAGQTVTHKSIYSMVNQTEVVNFPMEFLNSLDVPKLPSHILNLKIEVPIISLRNINYPVMQWYTIIS